MKTILNAYNNQITFSEDDTNVINKAIEEKILYTDDVIEDFFSYRDENLKSFENFDEDEICSFDEHYDNGLTHIENFINLVKFINN